MGDQDGLRWQPAWYADPMARHDHRWWDGAAWTAHVADGGVAGLDPIEPGPATSSLTAGAPTTTGAPLSSRPAAVGAANDPMAVAALAVGLVALPLALVPFLGVVAAGTALTLALVGRARIRRDASRGDGMAVAGLVSSIGALLLALIVTVTAIVVLSGMGGDLSDAFREYVACLEVRSEEECRALIEATMLRSLG